MRSQVENQVLFNDSSSRVLQVVRSVSQREMIPLAEAPGILYTESGNSYDLHGVINSAFAS